jgi:hypothetical protein
MVSVVMYSRDISPPGGYEVHAPTPPRLCIHPPGDARRREVEAFIRRVYAERYGADVSGFAPMLVSLQDDDGIVAAAGYRSAAQDRLFLEGYFDQPIESLLKPHTEQPLSRTDIVEIGHLASARAGEGRRLVQMISAHLVEQGFDWVVCTLTAELRHLFLRIGITPLALGAADPDALGQDVGRWGSYYDHHPVVLASPLQHVLHQMGRRRSSARLM